MFFLKIGLKDIQRAVLGSDLARFIQQGHLSSPSVLSLPLRSGHVPALPFRGGRGSGIKVIAVVTAPLPHKEPLIPQHMTVNSDVYVRWDSIDQF